MNMAGLPEAALRLLGGAFNLALAFLFSWLAFALYGKGMASIEAAGGLASASMLRAAAADPAVALGWISGFLSDPALSSRLLSYVLAWFSLVGAAGCGWMALLGARWTYHAALRALMAR